MTNRQNYNNLILNRIKIVRLVIYLALFIRIEVKDITEIFKNLWHFTLIFYYTKLHISTHTAKNSTP